MKRLVVAGALLLVAAKTLIAAHNGLFADEAFYWQCAQQLAPHYADHPFMTAFLVRGGTCLLGDTTLGVRVLFLLCGISLVPALWALARPIVGERDAWAAAGLVLVVPVLAVMGSVAGPDAPLALITLLGILLLERATRTGGLATWLGVGAVAALGLCTHYRFATFLLGALTWLLATPQGRACLRTPGPWLAGVVGLAGLLPLVQFNLEHDWRPLRYHFLERHQGEPGGMAAWIEQPAIQAGALVTPLLFAALVLAAVHGWRRTRRGDGRASLLLCLSGVHLVLFWITAPIADTSHASEHWPAAGYLPLLVLTPGAVRESLERRPWLRAAGVALGALLVVVGLLDAAFDWPLGKLHGSFAGWSELGERTRQELDAGAPSLVVADHYVPAAQLAFALGPRAEVYTLDHPKNAKHGRSLQYEIWGRDEAGLHAAAAGREALVVVEVTETKRKEQPAWLEHVTAQFEALEPLGEPLVVPIDRGEEERRTLFFAGRGVR